MLYIQRLGLLVIVKAAKDLFFNDGKLAVEVSQSAIDLSKKPKHENPIYLDTIKNGLLPNKILTTFKSPNFIGTPPPGITTFMTYQVFLSGERKGGYTYPLFLKPAIEDFNGTDSNISVGDLCNKHSDKTCPEGFRKVIVNPNGIEAEELTKEAVKDSKK